MTLNSWAIFILAVLFISFAAAQQTSCVNLRGNCDECTKRSDCAYCASPGSSGCFEAKYLFYCPLLGGVSNQCNATNDPQYTQCGDNGDCDTCNAVSGCSWCQTSTDGYCVDKTKGVQICSALSGKFECPSGATTETTSGTDGGNNTPTDDDLIGKVDTSGYCQSFSAAQCQGTIFYNVYLNSTDTQDNFNTLASGFLTIMNLPGVPPACREVATKFVCGRYFQKCEPVQDTTIAVSIPPCRSLCEAVNTECGALLGEKNKINCLGINSRTGAYAFPVNSTKYLFPDNSIREFQCNNMIPTGYYPNMVVNSGFEQFTDNGGVPVIKSWSISGTTPSNVSIVEANVTRNSASHVLKIVGEVSNSTSTSDIYVLKQEIIVNREIVQPIRISGISKAEGIVGTRDRNYSIVVDMFYQDGTSWKGINLTFDSQNNVNYTKEELMITPEKAVSNITIKINLNKAGVAYFDDVALQEKVPDQSSDVLCFEPYLLPNPRRDQPGEEVCVMACPLNIFDNKPFGRSVLTIQLVLGWMSFIAVVFLIITWSVFPWKRKYPTRLTVNFSIAAGVSALRFVVMSFYKIDDTLCKSSTEYLRSDEDSFCAFTGFTMVFGSTGIMCWWLCTVISTYVMILNHMKRRNYQWIEKYYHIVSWSICLFSAIITLAIPGYKTGITGIGGCWISGTNDDWWQLGIFYIPLTIVAFLGSVLIGHAMYIIYKTTNMHKKKDTRAYIRLGSFILIILITFVILFSNKFITYGKTDDLYRQFEQYVICRSSGETECGEVPTISSASFFFTEVCIAGQGLIYFIFFGMHWEIYYAWKYVILNRSIPAYSSIQSITMSGKHSSASELKNRNTKKTHSISPSLDERRVSEYSSDASVTIPVRIASDDSIQNEQKEQKEQNDSEV